MLLVQVPRPEAENTAAGVWSRQPAERGPVPAADAVSIKRGASPQRRRLRTDRPERHLEEGQGADKAHEARA